jgi:ATP-dependent exoDNAse (exonuclease V) beta subunit
MGAFKPPLSPDTEISFPEFVLLNASAGAGKTFQLSLRFVQFLLSDAIAAKMKEETGAEGASDLRNLLAITFTKNAAREMKERILGWLKGAASGDPEALARLGEVVTARPEEIRRKAAAAVDDVIARYSDLQVETIDSFMSAVFRASTLDLGVSPDYEIALDGSEILDYAFQRYLRRVGPKTPEGDRFLEISRDILAYLKEDGSFVWDPAALIGEKLVSLSDKLAARTFPPDMTDGRPLKKPLENKIKVLVGRIAASGFELDPRGHFGKRMIAAAAAGRFNDFLDVSFGTFPVKKPKGGPAPAMKAVERDWAKLEDVVKEFRGVHARGFFRPYVEAHVELARTLEEVKSRRGIVILEDIYKKLHGLLDRGEVPEVYFRLGDQIFHYLIDEFQDTSPIQWAVLTPLIENSLGGKGSLLLVGDTKQAIFGFRNADFRIQAEIAGKKGRRDPFPSVVTEVHAMEENFRSDGKVLEFVKKIFLENVRDSEEYAGAAKLSGLTDFRQEVPAARRDSGYAEYREIERDDETWPEKREIQDRVRDLLRRGYRFRDIGILTLKNESVVRVASWLNEVEIDGRNVPFIPFSSLDIRKRKITGEVLALLRFLDSPPDDLAFAAFLRSELLAARLVRDGRVRSREEWTALIQRFLFDRRAESRRGPAYTAFRTAFPDVWEKYLDRPFKSVGYFPLYDLVTAVYRGFDVFETFPREEATLAKLLEAIKDFEGMGKNDLGEFLAAAEDDEGGESKLDIDVPVNVDAVRIMSIHKAKGLGFPAVILLLYGERFQAADCYLSEKDGRVRVLRLTGNLSEADADLREVYQGVRDRDKVDRLNTLYVGLTRAKHELHVLGVRGERDPYPFDLFTNLDRRSFGTMVRRESCGPDEDGGGEAARTRFTEIAARSFTPRGLLSDPGVLRGIHGHAILAAIEAVRESWPAEVRGALDRLDLPESERPLAEDAGRAIVSFFENSDLAAYFAERPGRRILTEFEVCDDGGNILRIDRAVVDPGAVTILDFKTGAAPGSGEERTARDRSQMDGYLKAMREIFPEREVSGILAYIDQGRFEARG